VGDPRNSWWTNQGTIEEATLSIKPQGLFWEYGLYLTFSARGTSFGAGDSLEVTLHFSLPENAVVYDSWLWINDDISKGKILDRWTASNIYEGIVQRRQDPSILFKNSPTDYELRVFPMEGSETRKVKISYLMPAAWDPNLVRAGLPLHILNTSLNLPPALNLLVWPGADWGAPTISGLNGVNLFWTQDVDPEEAGFYKTGLPSSQFSLQPQLVFNSPLQNGVCLRVHNDGSGGGFYQLAFLPRLETEPEPKKLLLLLDKDVTGGNISFESVWSAAKSQLLANLQPTDSFNIIYSQIPVQRVSEQWLPARPDVVENAFNAVAPTDFSNLAQLMADGFAFIKEHGNEGEILLASSSGNFYTNQLATALHDLMLESMGTPRPRLHILDYRTTYGPFGYIGGQSYWGNEYLYFRLAQSTGGSFHIARNNNLGEVLASAFLSTDKELVNLDFYTTLEQGYCYGRYFTQNNPAHFLNRPVLQVGRYNGDFPFEIEMAGELDGEPVYREISVPTPQVLAGDTLIREMWFGRKLNILENSSPSNSVTLDIIQNSLEERVLTRFTAFLCLEDSTQYCAECYDETELTSTNTPELSLDSLLGAAPNPFTDQVIITLQHQKLKEQTTRVSFEIYNLNGQLIQQFELNAGSETVQLVWDGRDRAGHTLPAGVYVLMAQTGAWSGVMKLVKR
jgi:Ca-activated chloride channel family protein